MSDPTNVVRLLAVTSKTSRTRLREKLSPLDRGLVCIDSVDQMAKLRRQQNNFEVVLLPSELSDADWWTVWSELTAVIPQPSILVYTRQPTFQLWTAVLDLGGYDVISEPFDETEIKGVVLSAAEDYRSRCKPENLS